jgi:eukaryotic-like serine/threonine-protein kinase
MNPVFSSNGARIAYTGIDEKFNWDTWVVPALGGKPEILLRNASGLVWSGHDRLLFSEMRKVPHMGIVEAGESRMGEHDVYLPAHEFGMAHLSSASPDRKWVVVVEMDGDHRWQPCRVVPMDGSSSGHQVGPARAACKFGTWSPDGKWMYFTSNAGGLNHIWRQSFPDGRPEQLTSGPTEEEGIAMARDGRSFVTAVALENVAVWVHDARGDRQVSLEGNAADPMFTPDGKKLCYRIVTKPPNDYDFSQQAGEVWVADLTSGRSTPLVPGFQAIDYQLSADGQQVVMGAEDREGKPQIWLASFERQIPPRQIPNVEGRRPSFGPHGEIVFRGTDGFPYRVRFDGSGLRKAIGQPVLSLSAVSPDGNWVTAWARPPGDWKVAGYAFHIGENSAVLMGDGLRFLWPAGGGSVLLTGAPIAANRSYIVPLKTTETLPRIPDGGFKTELDVSSLPGAHQIDISDVVPGPNPDTYAFSRSTSQRNLYRIPIP